MTEPARSCALHAERLYIRRAELKAELVKVKAESFYFELAASMLHSQQKEIEKKGGKLNFPFSWEDLRKRQWNTSS